MPGHAAARLAKRALAAGPGAGGITLLPYLDGERTPDRPGATGVLTGLTTSNATPDNLARTAFEGVLCSLADAIDLLDNCGLTIRRALLIGGGARSAGIREIAPGTATQSTWPWCREWPAKRRGSLWARLTLKTPKTSVRSGLLRRRRKGRAGRG